MPRAPTARGFPTAGISHKTFGTFANEPAPSIARRKADAAEVNTTLTTVGIGKRRNGDLVPILEQVISRWEMGSRNTDRPARSLVFISENRYDTPSMDLYNDLEELRDMTHLLIDDVNLLRPKIGEGKPDP